MEVNAAIQDGRTVNFISTQVNAAAFLTWPPGYRGVNDQFFVAQGGTFGRVARLYLCGNQNFTARSC